MTPPDNLSGHACAQASRRGDAQPAFTGSRTRIAFFGFYGRHNFGDDLFGYLLQVLALRTPGIQPMIVGASNVHELTHSFRLPVVQAFWTRDGAIGAAARCVTYVAALLRARAAIFGGGSLFGANASLSFAKLIVSLARRLGKPVAALGVSIGPFETIERQQAFSEVVKGLSRIAVRDEASVHAAADATGAASVNLKDLAFALPAIYTPRRGPDAKRTLIVSIHLRQYIDTVLAILAEVDRQRLVDEVLFVSLDDESVAVTGDIARLFSPLNVRVARFKYSNSITEVIDLLAAATCVVTSKLHGAIVSYVYDVPVMLFCYQRKCAEFLQDNGLPGPRDSQPDEQACIRHVTGLLACGKGERRYVDAAVHLEQLTDFIAGVDDTRTRTGSA